MDLPVVKATRFDLNGQRFYEVDGSLYPSVTTVLKVVAKAGLTSWVRRVAVEATREAIKDGLQRGLSLEDALRQAEEVGLAEPERVRDAAAKAGLDVHRVLADLATAKTAQHPVGRLIQRFLVNRDLTPLAAEYTLISKSHGYAGTCDLVTRGPNGLVLIDWKTGGIYPEHALQLGAYALAIAEMTAHQVGAAYVVSISLDDAYILETRQVNLSQATVGFLSALSLWQTLRGRLFV